MELGTWDDAHEMLDIVGQQMFLDVLKAQPPEPPKAGLRTFGEG